jgi:serine/threonine-protein kinase
VNVLEVGRVVAGYRIERPLGSGAMGEVYLVHHVERDTPHALKYMPLPSRKIRQRLLREAEAQTRLSHPNVVTLTEVIDVDGDPGLVVEYVEGPTLDEWLAQNRPSLHVAETMFRGILAGVAHAHRRGLVHRDLKPSNVLLARTGTGLLPKVADFGIAKLVEGGDEDPAGITRTGTSLGSPAYMAPEQMRDARDVEKSADLWSLGCMLYELVCGARPFVGPDVLVVMNAAQAGDYAAPTQHRPDLPERFTKAITACLQVDPARRVGACEDLVAILDAGAPPEVGPSVHTARSPEPGTPRARLQQSFEAVTPRVRGNAILLVSALGGALVALAIAWALFQLL